MVNSESIKQCIDKIEKTLEQSKIAKNVLDKYSFFKEEKNLAVIK